MLLALRSAAILAGLALLACSVDERRSERLPDVVIVLIDTLRADWLGVYGRPDGTSPRIDRLARRAVVFEQANAAAPWTLPSVVSLFTSRFVVEHGVAVDGQRLAPTIETLAERLRRLDYRTASFFVNAYAGPLSGLDRGFDTLERVVEQPGGELVREWLASVDERPFFLYVHNTRPHNPYAATSSSVRHFGGSSAQIRDRVRELSNRYRAQTRVDFVRGRPLGSTDNTADQRAALEQLRVLKPEIETLYSGAVLDADADVSAIVEALAEAGRWRDTLFILLADHGEEMAEHGGWQHDHSVYEELIRVPLLLRFPADRYASRRVREPVSLIDVLPTLFDVLGHPELAKDARGRSLMPLVRDSGEVRGAPRVTSIRHNQKKHFRPWHGERGDVNVVVRQGRWKAILNLEPGRLELYDLQRDPGESNDLSSDHPELAAALSAFAKERHDLFAAARAAPGVEALEDLDAETAEALRKLGYLGGEPE